MRKLLIAVTTIGVLASIALCGGYGWDEGGAVLRDQVTQAFVYGFVAMATLALHPAAIRIWFWSWRKTGALVGAVAMLGFMMTAFTGLGGMASRGDRFVAERQDVLDTKADTKTQIAALVAEKAGMQFSRATQATVDAAKLLSDAARLAREQECGKLGENCRRRQDAEGTALTALAKAQENKAATERAIEIDAELKRLRLLKTDGTVGAANPLRNLLATIIGAWADVLTSWQKVAFVVIYDLTLVTLMIVIEVLGHAQNVVARPTRREEPEPTSDPVVEPIQDKPVKPGRPQLTVVRNDDGAKAMLVKIVDSAPGERIAIGAVPPAYATQCKAEGKEPVPPEQFASDLAEFCEDAGIKTRIIKGQRYLMDVRLAAATQGPPVLSASAP